MPGPFEYLRSPVDAPGFLAKPRSVAGAASFGIRTVAGSRPGRAEGRALADGIGLVAAEVAMLAGLYELWLVELGESESPRSGLVSRLAGAVSEASSRLAGPLGVCALALGEFAGTASLATGEAPAGLRSKLPRACGMRAWDDPRSLRRDAAELAAGLRA